MSVLFPRALQARVAPLTSVRRGPSVPTPFQCVYLPSEQSEKTAVNHRNEHGYNGGRVLKEMGPRGEDSDECCPRDPANCNGGRDKGELPLICHPSGSR